MTNTPATRPKNPPAPTAPAYSPADEGQMYFEYAELSQKMVKRPLVLFFGRSTFSDNTKYLFLATTRAVRDVEVVWCGWNKALLEQLSAHGLKCFDLSADVRQTCNLLLQASVAVFCENPAATFAVNNMLSGCLAGAQKIQLWHGVSVKHLDLMLVPHLNVCEPQFRRQIRFSTRVDHFLSTSSALDAFWVRAFGCTSLIRAGQPRNEVIVRPATPEEMIGSALPDELADRLRSGRQRKLLLTPTWQRGKPIHISTPAFYERLARWAGANDALVCVKAHPFMVRSSLPADVPGRLYFLGAGVDVYPWMSRFDALITDYSSIMFDFLLTHRPIFTFNSRTEVAYGFEPDYSLLPEGEFRYEFDAQNFEAVMEKNLADHPLHAAQRTFSSQLFETPAEDACARLIQMILECNQTVVDKSFTVLNPKLPAHLTRIAV